MNPRCFLLLALSVAAAPALAVTAADLERCRAIADAGARLACYDALSPSSPATVAAPAAAPGTGAAQFGLEQRATEGIDAVESRIPGRFEGWSPGTRIRLENGQVWQVVDGSRGVYWLDAPRVKVSRASFGTFMLEIEGARLAPRVRRVE